MEFSVSFEKEFTHVKGVDPKYYDKILRYFKKTYCANGTAVCGTIYLKGDFTQVITKTFIDTIIESTDS